MTLKKSKPFVSVIILGYNGLNFLKGCIPSIMEQDYPSDKYEIILADNGSQDETVAYIKEKFNSVKLLCFKKNHGFALGNNLATEYAKGDYLVYLNQDTIADRMWLSTLVEGVERFSYDACCSNMLMPRNSEFKYIENKDRIVKKVYYYDLNRYGYVNQRIVERKNFSDIQTQFITGASFIIKRTCIDRLGYLFDKELGSYGEDMDLSFRLMDNGFRIGVVSGSIIYHLSSFDLNITQKNIWKNTILIRNRLIVHWKRDSKSFLKKFPLLMFSQPHKVFRRCRQLDMNKFISAFYSAASLPLVILGGFKFLVYLKQKKRFAPVKI